ncbi:MAG: hypothetical protein ACPGVG_16405 [Mycobacterium sp.]
MNRKVDWSKVPRVYQNYRGALAKGTPPLEAMGAALDLYLALANDPQLELPLEGPHADVPE